MTIELIRKARGDAYTRLPDGRIVSANQPKTLVEKLIREGVADDSVRVVEGESYVQFLSLAQALASLSAPAAPEYSPRTIGQSYEGCEIWDAQRCRWVRPERPR